jgi:hypothetical protein
MVYNIGKIKYLKKYFEERINSLSYTKCAGEKILSQTPK